MPPLTFTQGYFLHVYRPVYQVVMVAGEGLHDSGFVSLADAAAEVPVRAATIKLTQAGKHVQLSPQLHANILSDYRLPLLPHS